MTAPSSRDRKQTEVSGKLTARNRPTTWQSVFRGPQIFVIVLVAVVAAVAFASGLTLVGALAVVVLIGQALLMRMTVRRKYAREDWPERQSP